MVHYTQVLVTAIVTAAAPAVAAQSTTVIPLLVHAYGQSLQGSVIAANAQAATYLVNCAPEAGPSQCFNAIPREGLTATQGPATYHDQMVIVSSGIPITRTLDCTFTAEKEQAACQIEVRDGSSIQISKMALTTYKEYMQPVTITAGVDKLASVSSPTATKTLGTTTPTSSSAPTSKADVAATSTSTSSNSGPKLISDAGIAFVAIAMCILAL